MLVCLGQHAFQRLLQPPLQLLPAPVHISDLFDARTLFLEAGMQAQ